MDMNRRSLLGMGLGLTGTTAFGSFIPRVASAAGARDPLFIAVILRGGLDGLAMAPPVGDPGFAALGRDAMATKAVPLHDMFALHPSLENVRRQFKAGHANIIHASATAYRDRSHFDGQDVLESGWSEPGHTETGWLNRLIGQLPAGQKAAGDGLSVGSTTPLVLRGPAEVMGWAPQTLDTRDDNLPDRVMALYQDADPELARAFDISRQTGKMAEGATDLTEIAKTPMTAMAQGAARLMVQNGGPRVAALAFTGWDTHYGEADRLDKLLRDLDGSLAAFETLLGDRWADTTILVTTEFGRTARVNGTKGTDHGTATTALLTGGAVKGGSVIADWPGLAPAQLRDGRDLAPTTDIRAVTKGVLSDLFDVSPHVLDEIVFPGSVDAKPVAGLIA